MQSVLFSQRRKAGVSSYPDKVSALCSSKICKCATQGWLCTLRTCTFSEDDLDVPHDQQAVAWQTGAHFANALASLVIRCTNVSCESVYVLEVCSSPVLPKNIASAFWVGLPKLSPWYPVVCSGIQAVWGSQTTQAFYGSRLWKLLSHLHATARVTLLNQELTSATSAPRQHTCKTTCYILG